MSYLPYGEPGIIEVLSLASFLIVLNVVRLALDKILYCGLIGEIFIGIIWGLPIGGTAWLSRGTQEVIQSFGYLGLIGLVFEGGLTVAPSQLREVMITSITVATVGLILPIALSFFLLLLPFENGAGRAYPTPLAVFSAGASLCSTSLGTTFAIISTADMQKTRLGVVLVGAAMMDDVAGLVMVNIVTTLGNGGELGAWQIVRPIVASFGLFLATLVITLFAFRPALSTVLACSSMSAREHDPEAASTKRPLLSRAIILFRRTPHLTFILPTFVLIALIIIASYIDASVLFAAFLAGGVVTHLSCCSDEGTTVDSGSIVYEQYFGPAASCIFVPFFWASIGFSIPITSMFKISVVWRGILYTFIMTLAKVAAGATLYFGYFLRKWKDRRQIGRRAPSEVVEIFGGPPHDQALLVAFAMVTRGEIGFLIASLAKSSGVFALRPSNSTEDSSTEEDLFLIVVWAVGLCTLIGPVVVGIIVKKQKRNDGQRERRENNIEL